MDILAVLSQKFSLKESYCNNIIALLDEGSTIPFIARYRKEMHGSCDDQTLRNFADTLTQLRNLVKRKEEVVRLLTEQGNLTEELSKQINEAHTVTEVEDIYRPFRPKKKTRASVAISAGLQPLADLILKQSAQIDMVAEAEKFINVEKGIENVQQALQGASDIIAEIIADDPVSRKDLREKFWQKVKIRTEWKSDKDEKKVFETYKDYSEFLYSIPPHRVLAINRGEKEGALKVSFVMMPEEVNNCVDILFKNFIKGSVKLSAQSTKSEDESAGKGKSESVAKLINMGRIYEKTNKQELSVQQFLMEAIQDGFSRLLAPSLETELRASLTETASEQAIKMFELNLKPLLLQPPLKQKIIMAVDPAYRTGCKIAVIDSNGNVLDSAVVYPTPPQNKVEEALRDLSNLIYKHKVNAIAIGNGTASKEAEIFVSKLIKSVSIPVQYAMVNEAGASVYSASKYGASEFPQYDSTIRSAISIARRLQDPLSELIKIDPKSIGVGQYQHDMPQKRLSEVLDGVVEDCVNSVGVDLNTASVPLLAMVSGLNTASAKSVADYRAKKGEFKSRSELTDVPKIGAKAFEQCAGFLRIPKAENILDNTAVHPESYSAVKKLLKHFNIDEQAIKDGRLDILPTAIKSDGEQKVAEICGVGVPTLLDMVAELQKPGRDIRDSLPPVELRGDLLSIEDLKAGMVLNGVVRNVIDFGAFVDIGVHQDGLVHISQICDRFIKHPSEELTVGDRVKVKIISIDLEKNRISLTMRDIDKD